MKRFIEFLKESVIEPSKESNTMSFWHGGNLDNKDIKAQKLGKYEFGTGLYCTTHYNTAKKYAKGSRKLYLITVKKGNNAKDCEIEFDKAVEFINKNAKPDKRKEVMLWLKKYETKKLTADIFNNILINHDSITPSKTLELRNFLIDQGVDYLLVNNAFGWHEMMIVIFNMKVIVKEEIVKSTDEIKIYDLPTEFN